ncbi:cyclin-domain-containing protein [Gongronella butleri]|nr:cyclin-domain-containing protein [Gongronella butleri]
MSLHANSILSCTNATQLADFCSLAVPAIWGPLNRSLAFKQFCQKIIKATQISCTCVTLSLYYIHRLRSAYPHITASMGSEIRLFTTALVLANKYLEDNTFTNKTWSQVSSIPSVELNIMEMEFLSALEYNVHLSMDQFYHWVQSCQQWMIPTLLHHRTIKLPSKPSASTSMTTRSQQQTHRHTPPAHAMAPPLLPPTPSASTPNLKRSHPNDDDDDDDDMMRRHAHHAYAPSSHAYYYPRQKRQHLYTFKMPYTPPEAYHPAPPPILIQQHHQTPNYHPHHHTPTIITDAPTPNDCPAPILSWSSSSGPSLLASRHLPASISAGTLHYSTSLLATKVQCLGLE